MSDRQRCIQAILAALADATTHRGMSIDLLVISVQDDGILVEGQKGAFVLLDGVLGGGVGPQDVGRYVVHRLRGGK